MAQGVIAAADIQAIGTQQIPAGGYGEFVRGQVKVDRNNGDFNNDR